MTRHTPHPSSMLVMFGVSVAIHLLLLLLLGVRGDPATVRPQARPKTVVAPLLSERELSQIMRKRSASTKLKPKPEPEPEPESKKDKKRNQQVVDIPPPKVMERPTQSRFLAEFNSKVKEEMLNRNRAIPQAAMTKSKRRSFTAGDDLRGSRRGRRGVKSPQEVRRPRPQAERPKRPQRASQEKREKKAQRERQKQSSPKQVQPTKKRKSSVPEGEGAFAPSHSERTESSSPSEGSARGGQRATPFTQMAPTHFQSLLPTLGAKTLARQDGSIDHVDKMKRGNRTALNTQEYLHATFFNRMKRALASHWSPQDDVRSLDPTGRVLGVQDRQTVLEVTLNKAGKLVNIKVLKTSGAHMIDQGTVRAFRLAQPFHNPPKELIDSDGLVRFKFGFYLEFNKLKLQLFR